MANTMKRIVLSALAVAVVTVAFAPSAQAQGLAPTCDTTTAVRITAHQAPIRPLSGFAILEVDVTYSWFNTQNAASFTASKISLTVETNQAWTIVTISPSNLFPVVTPSTNAGTDSGSKTEKAELFVVTTADAPAFTPGNIKVKANADRNGCLGSSSGEAETTVQADFFSIIDATTPTTIQKSGPQQQVVFPMTVTNYGNANTKIFFDVLSQPEGWQVVPPSEVILEARQQGGKATTKTANMVVQTPWRNGYLNEVGAVTMRMTSNYALDTKVPGDRATISSLTTVIGFYVPGIDTLLLVGGVGALAVALKHRRRDV
ncbi:MAG TPA: hypothetical protein VM681_08360 [Candidatus Thermoplasmatota archaeon]|nr:hypothetical protein [Candidatus Thermoplasmatota archaeon]